MEDKKTCEHINLPLIGDPAPAFTAETTQGEINFPADYQGKWVILFSHPADFTPVCSTEFMTFASMAEELKGLNCELIGLSIDSIHSHIAWLRDLEGKCWNNIKDLKIDFPLIADIDKEVSTKYGMLHAGSKTSTVRAVFIIDPEGIVRTILYYPASTGRNMDEIKRVLIALQTADRDHIATPANWEPGKDVILPPPATTPAARERMEMKGKEDVNLLDWYFTFQKDKKQD